MVFSWLADSPHLIAALDEQAADILPDLIEAQCDDLRREIGAARSRPGLNQRSLPGGPRDREPERAAEAALTRVRVNPLPVPVAIDANAEDCSVDPTVARIANQDRKTRRLLG
ncbi:hypothetical protein SAMN05216360_11796 [Methylobacterium phyllostachyos]|uniref:Uncharacterized protein n=1 Tax=Methylobacterium phyllostachyos TaxID=582672 RepID=A0A1H0I037_9HYPH|nr:hypothetical protein SAMN05216360_11796 [Methylobacterium phyllostachyos]